MCFIINDDNTAMGWSGLKMARNHAAGCFFVFIPFLNLSAQHFWLLFLFYLPEESGEAPRECSRSMGINEER